jgi:hypothetical protein
MTINQEVLTDCRFDLELGDGERRLGLFSFC